MNNLVTRTLTSVAFVIIMVAGLLFSPYVFGALMLVIMTVAMQEFYTMSLGPRFLLQQKLALLASAAFLTVSILVKEAGIDQMWYVIGALFMIAIPVTLVFRGGYSDMDAFAFIPVPVLSIALPVCLTTMLAYPGGAFNGWIILSLFIMIWASDVGAYLIGSLLGQKPDSRKLAPAISPKKSWWGFWGGLAFCVIAAVVLKLCGVLDFPYVHVVALGLIVGAAGVCGDLYESMWKRFFSVKDSGKCIPGHGGMYDRFDSSFFALPAAAIYMILTSLI